MSLGKVPERMVEPDTIEPSKSGKHDHPVSGNHQAASHWEQWNNDTYHILNLTGKRKGGKGREWKHGEPSTSEQAREMNWPQRPNCKTQKAPVTTPRPPHHVEDRWPALFRV